MTGKTSDDRNKRSWRKRVCKNISHGHKIKKTCNKLHSNVYILTIIRILGNKVPRTNTCNEKRLGSYCEIVYIKLGTTKPITAKPCHTKNLHQITVYGHLGWNIAINPWLRPTCNNNWVQCRWRHLWRAVPEWRLCSFVTATKSVHCSYCQISYCQISS